jgi:acyl-homoserine-lactone acylase
VNVGGTEVELTEACDVLDAWDLRVERDSRGAHLCREFATANGVRFAVPSDRSDPIGTPNTLDSGVPRVLQALGAAVQRLTAANIPLDARWDDVHYSSGSGSVSTFTAAPAARASST